MKRNITIAVTGGFCTGKSLVLGMLGKLGARIIDVDNIAHKVLGCNSVVFKKIVEEFGRDILVDNCIDRQILAKKVFGNKRKLEKLNSIVHPAVIEEMFNFLNSFGKNSGVIVVEVPLLFEAKLDKYFDHIIVVRTTKLTQIKRAIKKWKLNKIDIVNRINSQFPLADKVKQADFVIDNNNSKDKTLKQLKDCWKKITK